MATDGFFERLKQKMETGIFDLVHGGVYLTSGSAQHEGRFEDGVWHNWSDSYQVRPQHYHRPETIEALAQIVAQARKVRVVGGGHTFNASPLCEDTLISLDHLNKVMAVVLTRLKAGTSSNSASTHTPQVPMAPKAA